MIRASSLFLIVCIACLGCVRSPGGVSPSNIPLQQDGYRVLGPVEAADCKFNLLGIIPISGGNNLNDAVDEAMNERNGADALINISVETVGKYFILWSQGCTIVRATAVTIK